MVLGSLVKAASYSSFPRSCLLKKYSGERGLGSFGVRMVTPCAKRVLYC